MRKEQLSRDRDDGAVITPKVTSEWEIQKGKGDSSPGQASGLAGINQTQIRSTVVPFDMLVFCM